MSEGHEAPNALQSDLIPVVRRGHDLVVVAGPGSGTSLAVAAALVDRLAGPEAEKAEDPADDAGRASGDGPLALVIMPTDEAAAELAAEVAPVAMAAGLGAAALGPGWLEPEAAPCVFGTARAFDAALASSRLKLDNVRAVVIDGASEIDALGDWDRATTLVELAGSTQRILITLPLGGAVAEFVETGLRRSVRIPSGPPAERSGAGGGLIQRRVVPRDRVSALVLTVGEQLNRGAHHVQIHFPTDDEAADAGDVLAVHGYSVGAPGDSDSEVWLALDDTGELRPVDGFDPRTSLAVVSYFVPADPETLTLRHGGAASSVVLTRVRERDHLEAVATEAGFTVRPYRADPGPTAAAELDRLEADLRRHLDAGGLAAYRLLVDRLLDEWDPTDLAAAALALRAETATRAMSARSDAGVGTSATAGMSGAGEAGVAVGVSGASSSEGRVPDWKRLFVGVGQRDGVGPGDLLGAVTGETGLAGSVVGRIEIRENFSLVEVEAPQADRIIQALNGTSLRGRSMRVDYDRGATRRGSGAAGGGPRRPRPGQRPERP